MKKIARALDKSAIPYMVIGGQAVLLYGEPRLTKDIDITLGTGPDGFQKIKKVISHLKFKMLPEDPEDFLKKTMVLPVIDEVSGIRIDLIFSYSPYERQAIENAKKVKFGRTIIKFSCLEDIIIHKIVAGRPRDMEDVKKIILKNRDYNKKYICKWLNEFDTALATDFIVVFGEIEKTV